MRGKASEPTGKVRQCLLEYIENPFQEQKALAEKWGIRPSNFARMKRNWKDWMNEQSDLIWRDSKHKAYRMMEKRAFRDGNVKALEFILRSNGVNPEQKISVDNSEIKVTIDDITED